MLQHEVVARVMTDCQWSESHGAHQGYLGMGGLYFGIPYSLRAGRCVCLGSGGGFVPRLMVEAQRALGIDVDVTLIDAGDGGTSGEVPRWQEYFFREYPEVRLIEALTSEAVDQVDGITYLHVDADHSYEHVTEDLELYVPKMTGEWAITVHDTWQSVARCESWRACVDFTGLTGLGLVNFPIGCGTALIAPRRGK